MKHRHKPCALFCLAISVVLLALSILLWLLDDVGLAQIGLTVGLGAVTLGVVSIWFFLRRHRGKPSSSPIPTPDEFRRLL